MNEFSLIFRVVFFTVTLKILKISKNKLINHENNKSYQKLGMSVKIWALIKLPVLTEEKNKNHSKTNVIGSSLYSKLKKN